MHLLKQVRAPKLRKQLTVRHRRLRMEILEDRHLLAPWSGDIPNGTIWPTGVVQQVSGNIHVPAGATLTVQPGAIIKFYYGDNSLKVDGTLNAQGSAAQPIVFTSLSDDSAGGDTNNNGNSSGGNGDWGGIQLNSGSTGSVLDHVEVRFAGGWSEPAEVYDKGGPLTLTNSVLRNSYRVGVRIEGANPTLTNDTWTNGFGAAVSMDLAASPAISGVSFTNFAINGVTVDGGTLPADNAWDDPDIVYWLTGNVTVPTGKTLTVSPGQIIKLAYGDNSLIVNGTLKATGTLAKPVIFTSNSDDSAGGDTNNNGNSSGNNGDWGGIQFGIGSANNLLSRVEVRDGGSWSRSAAVTANAASVQMQYIVIRNSYRNGLLTTSQAQVSLSSSLIVNSYGAGLRAESGATITAINSTIDGNSPGVYVDGSATLVRLTNNLITNNGTAGVYSTNRGVVSLAFNDLSNNVNYSGVTDATGKQGNLAVDPKYVNRASGDYHLQGTSPAIDAGTSDGTTPDDLDFNSRIDQPSAPNTGGGSSPYFDLGAYEYGGRPRAVESEPVGANVGPIGSVLFTFRGAMDTTSFSIASDVVSFSGPNGAIAPYAFHWANAYQLEVDFPPQGVAGSYSMVIGPNISDASGHAMDQDGDGVFGAVPADEYTAAWTITPPRIISQSPSNFISGAIDHFTFTFDRPMDTTTFALAGDIVRFTGPSGNLTATGFNWSDSKTLTVSFAPQTALGFYEMDLSPQIADASGNVLDQNGNQIGGESPADQYQATATLANILFVSGAVAQNTTWSGLVLVQDNVTVNSSVTLTIAPGTIVKFSDNTNLTISSGATLTAIGTSSQPIYFTSLHDDSLGGDMDLNGNLVGPSAGDWGQINNKGIANLDHVQVLYGSGIGNTGLNSGAVRNEGGSLIFADSIISQAFYDGLDAVGGTITMSNSLVIGADRGVVSTLSGSTISILNSTIDNNRTGVFEHAGGAVTIKNSIVSNSLQVGILTDSGTVPTTYSNVWSSVAGAANYSGMADQTGKSGNLSVDPKFMAAADGNYRLAFRSPMIDAADGTSAPVTDFFGHARYDDPRTANTGIASSGGAYADIGAMEFLEGATSPVDLAASAVGAPSTAIQGDKVSVQWTVTNTGTDVARGSWNDGVYLSSDAVWSTDDVLLANATHLGDLGVNQSYQATASFSMPAVAPGTYYVLVRTNFDNALFEGQNLSNNVAASAQTTLNLPQLPIGAPVQDSLLASGAIKAYQLVAPAGKDVVVTLTGASGTTNELYARAGSIPSWQEFDERSAIVGQANQSIVIPSSQGGTTYILVRAAATTTAESFTLSASTPGFSITSLLPAKGDYSGSVTVTFQGASFTSDAQPQLIDSAGQTINASAVYFTDSTSLSATFDLRGHAVGNALATLTVPGTGSTQLSGAFQIVSGSPGTLSADIVAPNRVRLDRDYSVVVEYTNTGNTDLLAPIMRLTNSGTSPLSFTHDFSGNLSYLDLVGVNSSGPAGILPPGAHGRIEVFAHSTGPGNSADSFQLTVGNYPATPINWDGMQSLIRPLNVEDATWTLLLAQLKANIGANWSDYQRAISNDATLLSPTPGLNYSLLDVVQLEYDRAWSELNQSLSGQLLEAGTSAPISGATVTLTNIVSGDNVDAISMTDGSFLIQVIDPGTYSVSVDGYVLMGTSQITVGSTSVVNVPLVASPAGTISGSVLLGTDGTPQPNVLVFASSDAGVGFSAYTDANGNYSVDSLPPGTYQVTTPAGQYTSATVTGLTIGVGTVVSHVNLAVGIGATLEGNVSGPSGPLAGATVTAVDPSGAGVSATTSSSGDYTISGLAGQSYTVLAAASGLASAEQDSIVLPRGGTVSNVNFTLGIAGTISGVVTQASLGTPVGSVVVSATSGANTYNAMTAADGTYSIAGLPPGSYTVSVRDDAIMTASANATVTANATTSVPLSVVVRGAVSGTVTNSVNSAPIANVTVQAVASNGSITSAVTDVNGKYQLTGLDADTYFVALADVSSPAVVSTQVTITPALPNATANLSAAVAGTISGTVYAADGTTPLAGMVVGLVEGTTPLQSMLTDDQGQYSFILVAPGTFNIEAGGAGLAFAAKSGLAISDGTALSGQNLVAGQETLSGIVTDAVTGQPLAEAAVRVSRVDGVASVTSVAGFVTDASGAYSVTGAVAGTYRVTALVDGYALSTQNVTITSGVAATLNLPLVKEGEMHGIVRDAVSQAPIAGATVSIRGAGAASFAFFIETDGSGTYDIPQLPAGSYNIIVTDAGHATSVVQNVALAAQQNLAQDVLLSAAAAPVSGIASNAAGPLGGISISATDSQGFVVASATTAADGSYSLTTLAAGNYSVIASAPGYRTTASTPITVPSGGLTGINFTLVAVALIDPPPTGEGESNLTIFDTVLVNNFFGEPKKSAAIPGPTFLCPDGKTPINDQAGFAAAEEAYKQLQDAYDGSEKVRDQLPSVLNDINSKLATLKAKYAALQAGLKDTGLLISGGSTLKNVFTDFGDVISQNAPTQAELDQRKKEQQEIDDAKKGLANAGKFIGTILNQIGSMDDDINDLRDNQASGYSGFNVFDVISLNEKISATSLVLGLGGLVADDPPGLDKRPQAIQDQVKKLRALASDASSASDDLSKSVGQLKVEVAIVYALGNAGATYKSVVEAVLKHRSDLSSKQCSCTMKAPASSGSGESAAAATSDSHCDKCHPPQQPIGPANPGPSAPPNSAPNSTTQDTTQTDKPVSSDPNDKIGPTGFGPNHVVAAGTMPYEIEFENAASAGATIPAQQVVVTDPLDANLDPTSVQFTAFGFGGNAYSVPVGLSHYSTTIDLRPTGTNLLVTIQLDVNPATHVLTAMFGSLDPITLLAPDDVDSGFLPVNDASHRGEGFVKYQVKPVSGIASGTTIKNQASIVFDTNAPILTPTTSNVIDVAAPTSSLIPLTPRENSSFTVKWTGSDETGGAGVRTFDVFIADNGGPFTKWQSATAATSAVYSGAAAGHTYGFYIVAADNVGHVQTVVPTAQMQTVISDNPWQNAEKIQDVNHDGIVAPNDLTALIIHLNGYGAHTLPSTKPAADPFLDADGDGVVAPKDLVKVIIYLNAFGAGEGEAAAVPNSSSAGTVTEAPAMPTTSSSMDELLALLAADLASQPKRRR